MLTLSLYGQQTTIRGSVHDAATATPLEMAAVKLIRGSGERLVGYTFTDSNGAFILPSVKDKDSLQLAVSLLGYSTYKQPVRAGQDLRIKLEAEVIHLREVVVRPGRVWGRQDTLNYDVSQFMGNTDESIKDVIGKLPGVDVDENGKISYNGKDIHKFYVEGMDLVDGRYNQITKNLQARSVETVQVLDNHQPIRMLRDKLKAEDVAINLKLKPEFRDKWMVFARTGAGFSTGNTGDDVLWMADMNAMQLSRNSQSAYVYKGNNMGRDVSTEQMMLIVPNSSVWKEPAVPAFLTQPSLAAPLKTERLLFNNVHTLSGNRLYRINETSQLRINAGYTHDYRKQERGSQTSYYEQQDTILIAEQSHTRIRSDKANLSLNYENNSEKRYLTNKFSASGDLVKSTSDYYTDNPLRQQIETNTLGVKNEWRSLWNRGKYTLEARSLLRFNHSPSLLRVDDREQKLNLNHFYTDHSFSLLKKKGAFTQQYTAGGMVQTSNIKNGYSFYITPMWQYNSDKWRATFTVPAQWTRYTAGGFSRLMANPSLSLQYKYNYAWQFRAYGSLRESYGSITDFFTPIYNMDYRQQRWNSGTLSVERQQIYSLYAEYKNTIKEFFATLSITHNRGWSNQIAERLFRHEQIILASRNLSSSSSGWSLNGTLSKGVYDWRLKASLNYQLTQYRSEQLSNGERVPYQSRHMLLEPKINWNPLKPLDMIYEGSIRYGGSEMGRNTRPEPLMNIVQKLNLYYNFTFIELGFTADHYFNDVSSDKSIHAFLIDASLRWKSGSWQWDFQANNLLNKEQYSYTQYSSLQRYSSWINIRGREFCVSARYRF